MSSWQRVRVTEVSAGQVSSHCSRWRSRWRSASRRPPGRCRWRSPCAPPATTWSFLFGEGVINSPADVVSLRHCRRVAPVRRANTVTARRAPGPALSATALARRFTVTSACGACGLDSLDALAARGVGPVRPTPVHPDVLLDRKRCAGKARAGRRVVDPVAQARVDRGDGVDGALVEHRGGGVDEPRLRRGGLAAVADELARGVGGTRPSTWESVVAVLTRPAVGARGPQQWDGADGDETGGWGDEAAQA